MLLLLLLLLHQSDAAVAGMGRASGFAVYGEVVCICVPGMSFLFVCFLLTSCFTYLFIVFINVN